MPKFANPDEKAPDYSLLQLLRDVWGFAQPYRGKLFLISILTASREASSLYGVYAFANIVTLLSNDASAHVAEIRRVIMLLITTIAWQFISVYFSRIYGSYIVEKIGFDLELEGIRHLFKVDIAWHEKENAGNKLKRINNGTSGVQQIIRLWLNSIIQIVVTILGAIFIVAKFNFFTAAIIVVFIAVHYAMSYYLTRKAARSSYAASLQSETVSGLEVQAVSNIRTVKVMALTEPLHKKIFHEITDLYEKVRRRIFLFQTRASLLALWGQSVRLGTLIYIVFGVIRGQYELGFLILFNGYFNIIRDLAGSLSDLTQDITIARFSVSRLESLLQTPTPIEDATGKEDFPSDWKKVYIQNVAFSYGDNQVLHDISFTVTRGEKIGIVGLSGAGKSTLFKLLLKEHEDFSGSILFDEVPIQNIKATDYFKHVAVVLQETEVFNFFSRWLVIFDYC
jgi:ABC-type multidrug transport system fused ATPase/permease subunit